jgi:hypothetical protein
MSDFDYRKPVKVVVSDPDTGQVLEEKVVANDYCVLTVGNRYVKHLQIWGTTHTFSIAVRKPGKGAT